MEKLYYERLKITLSQMLATFNLCGDSLDPGTGEGGEDDDF